MMFLKYMLPSFICVVFLCVLPTFVYGQINTLPGVGDLVTFEITPKDMVEPFSDVSISARGFLLNLDRSTIVWMVDGVHVADFDGRKSVVVKVGNIGVEKKITFIARGANGLRAQSDILLRPTELEVQWEGDGFVPPLYRGRTLVSPGTNIVAHAEARFMRTNGTLVSPEDVIYSC